MAYEKVANGVNEEDTADASKYVAGCSVQDLLLAHEHAQCGEDEEDASIYVAWCSEQDLL
jgi:hypothetical protein